MSWSTYPAKFHSVLASSVNVTKATCVSSFPMVRLLTKSLQNWRMAFHSGHGSVAAHLLEEASTAIKISSFLVHAGEIKSVIGTVKLFIKYSRLIEYTLFRTSG